MHTISETVHIETPPDQVWKILTHLDDYPLWNPFIREAEGTVAVGSTLTLKMLPGTGGRPTTFRPVLQAVVPGRELRWKGRLLVPGIFDGEHRFLLEPTGTDACTLTQSEKFTGLLVPLLGRTIQRTAADFRALNQALKHHAETQL